MKDRGDGMPLLGRLSAVPRDGVLSRSRVPTASLLMMHLRGRVLEAAPGHGLR